MKDDNVSFVVCKICGKKGRELTDHLKKKHDLSRREYEEQYFSPAVCYERQLIEINNNKVLYDRLKNTQSYLEMLNKVNTYNSTKLPYAVKITKRDILGEFNLSGYESQLHAYLIKNQIKFSYKSYEITYISVDKKEYIYMPTFFLSDYNLVLEAIPKKYSLNKVNQIKKNVTEQLGYKFLFVTENELKDLNNFFHNKIYGT